MQICQEKPAFYFTGPVADTIIVYKIRRLYKQKSRMTDQIQLKAYAKINLGLDITGKREDGYHLISTVMQTIGICDDIVLERTKSRGIRLLCLPYEPSEEKENLVWKAAHKMFDLFSLPGGADITLEKRVPMAAGLAGGSSDAAAVLRGMDRIFGLNLPEAVLLKTAEELGADVPYCLAGGTVLAEGIGEKLTALPAIPDCTVVVIKPDIGVSTAGVYADLDGKKILPADHPDMAKTLACIREGDMAGVSESMGNILEIVTAEKHPFLKRLKKDMKEAGAMGALMSGSGPSVFSLFGSDDAARRCIGEMKRKSRYGVPLKYFIAHPIKTEEVMES